jgi:hypothetical protein
MCNVSINNVYNMCIMCNNGNNECNNINSNSIVQCVMK